MEDYIFREATIKDVDFIVTAIIEAEKSGSAILSYSKIFNLSEAEVSNFLRKMLFEEIDGCEFSLSNYIVAEFGSNVVGTTGAWIERSDSPSAFIKRNLLSYFLPKESMVYALSEAKIASELVIDHLKDVLSLVVSYISPEHRGKNLFELLAKEHLKRNDGVTEIALQVMANNTYAIKSYEKLGFKEIFRKKHPDKRIMDFLPYDEKLLMKKRI